jgi:hypothetical protein
VTWSEGALQQAFVAYIPVNEMFYSGFSSLVLYNQRVSGQNKVFIHNVGNGTLLNLTELMERSKSTMATTRVASRTHSSTPAGACGTTECSSSW